MHFIGSHEYPCNHMYNRYPCGAGSNLNCSCSPWGVPIDAIMPLAYWIVFNSATAYFLMTWGNKYADASKVNWKLGP